MSRTEKSTKGPGYEYWSRRPTKFPYAEPGRITKKNTHKMERAKAKKELKDDNNHQA